jgi:hypothetical protein
VKARPGLMVLLAVAVLFVLMKYLPSKSAAHAATGRAASEEALQEESGRKGKSSSANRPLEPPVVAVNLLTAERQGETFEIGRDLFRYAPPKPKAPEPGRPGMPGSPFNPAGPRGGGPLGAGAAGGAVQPVPAGTPLGVPQDAPPTPPQTPTITFKYLGSFGPPGRTLAVFSDNSEIIDVLEGETFSSQFILKKINRDTETVEIGFVGFDASTIQKLEVGP